MLVKLAKFTLRDIIKNFTDDYVTSISFSLESIESTLKNEALAKLGNHRRHDDKTITIFLLVHIMMSR